MPGIKVTDEDRQRIKAEYFCRSCKLLLDQPFQTSCGHLICGSCLENLLGSSNPRCPVDGTMLSEGNVNPDNFKKRELQSIRVHCTNPGCLWYSTYERLEDHLSVHELMKCIHLQCQMEFQRSHLGEHLKNECKHENAGEAAGKECSNIAPTRKRSALVDMTNERVDSSCEDAHSKKKRNLQKDDCVNPVSVSELEDVQPTEDQSRFDHPHLNNGSTTWVSSLVLYFSVIFAFPSPSRIVQDIRDEIAEKFVMLFGKLTGLERRIETLESSGGNDTRARIELSEMKVKLRDVTAECTNLRERNTSLERELRDTMSIIERLQSRMDQIDESVALNTVKITDLESQKGTRAQQAIHSYNGTLLWKIEGYQRKRQDAINGVKTALYSPPFYSAQYGYKMCAKIYMNGDGFGKGTHLSLFFVVMRGDYDALQTWPFQKKITMMLLDQGNGDHMIDAFHSDPQSSSFQRPKSAMNIASGSPLFMPLDSLNNRQYIKDDVMFIKVIVD